MWTLLSGVYLGWSLGANDAANIFGTGVGTGMVKYRTAIWLTAFFAIIGALLEGPKCMNTLSALARVIPLEAFICALAAAITMTVLTILAIPASVSQAIVGAVLGIGALAGTADYSSLYKIIICWVATPIFATFISFVLHRALGYVVNKTVKGFERRNLIFLIGIFGSGCYGAYCLGANNVANVTGVYVGAGILTPDMAALIGGLSIAFGVLTYSKKVMMTVGKDIAPLDPFSALIPILGESLTLHIFTQVGVPVSSSQAIVGAVVGVGLSGDMRTVSYKLLGKIAVGWVMTPVSSGVIAVAFSCLASFIMKLFA